MGSYSNHDSRQEKCKIQSPITAPKSIERVTNTKTKKINKSIEEEEDTRERRGGSGKNSMNPKD